ncbi:DUF4124 domain-containing protein [Acidovorax sp. D4N7]|uniref:DUF4124 domain-containing protein n=2 Tax=Comamonas endophytica TaxID=2949090 RepID=A0ABY6GG27_9BURK|nr:MULTISPECIES: DUF4124 domain-containing protein [unclassified Acidovorax]MCD2512586.1 DUF4124 domain-containing protein [Acidovorax sp. D4N7]UYG53275.1 DUF4124 domain-containing protein [Acidovorax sp. 5MLIR]
MAQNPPEAGIYSCTDAQGRRLTADRPIVACLDREQRVYGRSGVERARVGPSLTDAEREAQALQRRQQLQAEQRARDELRRQRALAYRYPDQAAHDAERAAAIAQIDDLAALAQRRAQDLRAERRKLDSEMEFYARDPARAPAALRRQLALNDESQAEQARYLAAQEQEKRRIHQRFDAELAQLRQLWAPAP